MSIPQQTCSTSSRFCVVSELTNCVEAVKLLFSLQVYIGCSAVEAEEDGGVAALAEPSGVGELVPLLPADLTAELLEHWLRLP